MFHLTKLFFAMTLTVSVAHATPLQEFEKMVRRPLTLREKILSQGVPAQALQRLMDFLRHNGNKKVRVAAKVRPTSSGAFMDHKTLTVRTDYATIIDFSRPSDEKRLYLINLKTGTVEKHLVAHGKGSGVRKAVRFSNEEGSKMSSLGLFLGGGSYFGNHGESLNLFGLERSNNAAAQRDIVFHGASYATQDFIEKEGRLGRSWGCPAVAPNIMQKILKSLRDGRVVYGYHPEFLRGVGQPTLNHVGSDEADVDLPGEEETLQKGKATFQWPSQQEDFY